MFTLSAAAYNLIRLPKLLGAAQPVTSPVPGELLAGCRSAPLGIKMGLNRGTKRILPYV
jgi:hypothetical protein